MELEKLVIKLKEEGSNAINLESMSSEALDSFMTVVKALKELTLSIIDQDEITFTISKGSAIVSANAPSNLMEEVYQEVESAIGGQSEDREIISKINTIQKEIKRAHFDYYFHYEKSISERIPIHNILKKSKRLSAKRDRNRTNSSLVLLNGLLNQVGGKKPNYHFDYGGNDKITIDCSKEDAQNITRHLYKNVYSLLIKKEWPNADRKPEYTHKTIVEKRILRDLQHFLSEYNLENDLLIKLDLLHDFIDLTINEPIKNRELLGLFIKVFDDKIFHPSEIKTILLRSKHLKNDKEFYHLRDRLFSTYKKTLEA